MRLMIPACHPKEEYPHVYSPRNLQTPTDFEQM